MLIVAICNLVVAVVETGIPVSGNDAHSLYSNLLFLAVQEMW